MINVDLKNIKAKSIRAVFLSIASSQKTTRAEIARDTGLSLMTVGKIADILTRAGITEEEKESSGAVGRRASSIRISGLYYGIILDVSSDTYICEIVDAATKTMDQFSYAYNRDYYKEENLLLFLKNLSLYLSTRYDPEKCFGIGVIEEKFLRGTSAKKFTASAQESDSASIRKETQKALAQYSQSIQWMSRVEAAAHHAASRTPEQNKSIILYCYAEENIQSVMLVQGKPLTGKNGAIGNIEPQLEHLFPLSNEPKPAAQIATAIKQAAMLLDPHKLVIEIDGHTEAFIHELQNHIFDIGLNQENCTLTTQGARNARRGAALRVRDQWIHSVVSSEI